jgi:hypothetical protein
MPDSRTVLPRTPKGIGVAVDHRGFGSNPECSDVKYVKALIGPETVNTAPVETLDA